MQNILNPIHIKFPMTITTETNYPVAPFIFKHFSVSLSPNNKAVNFHARYIYKDQYHFETEVIINLLKDQDFDITPCLSYCYSEVWPDQIKEEIYQGILTSPQLLPIVFMLMSLQPKEYFQNECNNPKEQRCS